MTTMRDIAKRAGVSTAVVSAVISGKKSNIRMSQATRERVEQVISASDYRLNHAARALSSARSGVIAAVVPKITNPVFEQVILGAQAAAEAQGDVLLLADSNWIKPGTHLMNRIAGSGIVDGALIRSTEWGTETVEELSKRSIPYVVMQDRELGREPSVWIDAAAGFHLAASHLLSLGHRRIALVGGPGESYRVRGYRKALDNAGVSFCSDLIQQRGYGLSEIGDAVRDLLNAPEPPTAMILDNITAAAGAFTVFADLGVQIPQDLSVVAYQDLPVADFMRPSPTTIRMPLYQAGERAYAVLRSMIDGGTAQSQTVVDPGPELVDRGSTAALT